MSYDKQTVRDTAEYFLREDLKDWERERALDELCSDPLFIELALARHRAGLAEDAEEEDLLPLDTPLREAISSLDTALHTRTEEVLLEVIEEGEEGDR